MGFEQLKNIIDSNKEELEKAREEEMNPKECPQCSWPLDVNSKGEKSCEICGWIGR